MAVAEFRLVVSKGFDAGKELIVRDPSEGPTVIGRDVDGERDLICADSKVSRRHATIEASDRGYFLTDLNSTNRTRLNGRLLKPEVAVPLRNGDEMLFGPDTLVRFELGNVDETAPSEPSGLKERFRSYEVYEQLDKDEADRVDVAIDTTTGARVALKRFDGRHLPKPLRKRVLDQAAAARRWQHPNIAAVLDAGEEGEMVYVVSRLVDGVSLLTVQDRCARDVEVPMAAYVVREACVALGYAQQEEPGFVHRNLTPHSIMLGYTGEVVLINFGFTPVKALQEGTVRLGRSKAHYLAPEHRAQRGLEQRSDIFSLGIVLYELLTQEPMDARRMMAPPDVQSVRPEVPADLAVVAMRAIARRPEERFDSAAEMEAALSAALMAMAPGYGPPEVTAWMIRMRLGVWR